MPVFNQKELKQSLERHQQRYSQVDKLSRDLSEDITNLEGELNYAYDEEKKISLNRSIPHKKAKHKSYENELSSLAEKISSIRIELSQEKNNEESSDKDREFSKIDQSSKNSGEKEEEFNPESKVIQEFQKSQKQTDKTSENKTQDIHAQSLIKDDEIKNTVLYTVTFFPQLSVEDFDKVVAFLLEGQTKEFVSISEIIDDEGKVKTIKEKEIKNLSELWRSPNTPTYKDELLSQCYIEPQQLANSFEQVIDFTENYSYLRDEFLQLFKKSGFYSKDKFQKIQHLIFWRSKKVVANAIIIAVNMALSDPIIYRENFLLGIINSLSEYEEQKLVDTFVNSLVSEQSSEQRIFNIKKQQQESEEFKCLVCESLAALVYKMEENPGLRGISNNFLNQIMASPINRYDVVLEICKYLRNSHSQNFDEIYWIKQILSRGDAESRDKAYKFLFNLLKQSKNQLYKRLEAIEEWLPSPSQNPDNYSTLNQYALQIFVEYSLEQTSNLNVEYYGEYPSKHSLFYSLQDNEVEDKLNTLVNFLFCLYIDKTKKYNSEELALSYIVDNDVNAIDLISFLIAEWYIILHGLQNHTTNPDASKLFELLLKKIINRISPYSRRELIKSWVRFGKYLLNEKKSNMNRKQEFLTRYNLVKQLKDKFSILEKSII